MRIGVEICCVGLVVLAAVGTASTPAAADPEDPHGPSDVMPAKSAELGADLVWRRRGPDFDRNDRFATDIWFRFWATPWFWFGANEETVIGETVPGSGDEFDFVGWAPASPVVSAGVAGGAGWRRALRVDVRIPVLRRESDERDLFRSTIEVGGMLTSPRKGTSSGFVALSLGHHTGVVSGCYGSDWNIIVTDLAAGLRWRRGSIQVSPALRAVLALSSVGGALVAGADTTVAVALTPRLAAVVRGHYLALGSELAAGIGAGMIWTIGGESVDRGSDGIATARTPRAPRCN